jgi:hypothetical protein
LPPEQDRAHDHGSTVVCVATDGIGKARAPKRFCEGFITMRPGPASFLI